MYTDAHWLMAPVGGDMQLLPDHNPVGPQSKLELCGMSMIWQAASCQDQVIACGQIAPEVRCLSSFVSGIKNCCNSAGRLGAGTDCR